MSPDRRQHRGPHPGDRELFASETVPTLREATAELSWLLTRGYAIRSALKLAGDRHALTERQRAAVARAACSDQSLSKRARSAIPPDAVAGEPVMVDGFNLIVTAEAALSNGLLISCRDGCLRDLSSVYGSYRTVQETELAVELIGSSLSNLRVVGVQWLLDRPISNSGRLAGKIREISERNSWACSVDLPFNPDAVVQSASEVAITSDSMILDGVRRWSNLLAHMRQTGQITPWVIELGD